MPDLAPPPPFPSQSAAQNRASGPSLVDSYLSIDKSAWKRVSGCVWVNGAAHDPAPRLSATERGCSEALGRGVARRCLSASQAAWVALSRMQLIVSCRKGAGPRMCGGGLGGPSWVVGVIVTIAACSQTLQVDRRAQESWADLVSTWIDNSISPPWSGCLHPRACVLEGSSLSPRTYKTVGVALSCVFFPSYFESFARWSLSPRPARTPGAQGVLDLDLDLERGPTIIPSLDPYSTDCGTNNKSQPPR